MTTATRESVRKDARLLLEALDTYRDIVEAHIKLTGVPATHFGVLCGGGIDHVRLLRAGKNTRIETMRKALKYIAYPRQWSI